MEEIEFGATPDQIEAIECKARFLLVAAGRQFGKTKGIIQPRLAKRCLERPPYKAAYVAPTYLLGEEQREEWEVMLAGELKHVKRRPPYKLTFYNKSTITIFSWERPRTIRGFGYDEIAFDEIQEVKNPVQFWSVLMPLITARRGTLGVYGQFRGKNWYYKSFVGEPTAHPDRHPSHKHFIFPASRGILYQGPHGRASLAEAKRMLPAAVYDQEYECIPAESEAAVLRSGDIRQSTRGEIPDRPQPGKFYIAAYDLGMFRDHPALCILEVEWVTDPDTGERVLGNPLVVFAERVPLLLKHELQAKRLGDHARRWNAQVVIDATAGGTGGKKPAEEVLKFYRGLLPDARFVVLEPGVKATMVLWACHCFERGRISIPARWDGLIEELGLYEYIYKNGTYYYGREGQPDDQVISLFLALYAMRNGWVRESGGRPLAGSVF